jgi:hypothetical protein
MKVSPRSSTPILLSPARSHFQATFSLVILLAAVDAIGAGYAEAVLADGPIAYWRFNDATPVATNSGSLGAAANGTYYGNAAPGALAPRPPAFIGLETNNTALQLDGAGDFVSTIAGLLSGRSVFTVSGWFRRNTDQPNRTGLWGQNDLIEIGYITNDTIQVWTKDFYVVDISPNPFPNGQWAHLAIVSDASPLLSVYTNGQLAASIAHSLPGLNSLPFDIGSDSVFGSGSFFNGQIDEVAVFDQALSAEKIVSHYNAAVDALQSGPSFLVTTTSNHDDGRCSVGDCTLLEALNAANAAFNTNTIHFAPSVSGTITNNSATNGYAIVHPVTIIGPGADRLTISGNHSNRVFHFAGGSVSVSGLTVANGLSANGGGIRVDGGSHNIFYSVIASNAAPGSFGTGGGGLLLTGNSTLNIYHSSIIHNQAGYSGGGIRQNGSNYLLLQNCTIAGNRVTNASNIGVFPHGGGIALSSGLLTVRHSTIAGNAATTYGGGIGNNVFPGTVSINNSIASGNIAPFTGADVAGTFTSGGYNLISATNGSTGFGVAGDLLEFNPNLAPLAHYGFPTPTMPPQPPSPAIDQGVSLGLTTDQRGRPRPFDDPGAPNASGSDGSDIGAVELGAPVASTLVVTTTNDSGPGSLRQTILDAYPSETTITFAPNVTNTITLTTGELLVNKALAIDGPGANVLAVSGNNSNRVFHLTGRRISISGLTIANGRVENAHGGGILAEGDVHTVHNIASCQIVSNAVTGFGSGGGICLRKSSYFSVSNSSVVHNTADVNGGGIALIEPAILDIYSSTIAGNRTTHIYDGFPPFPHGGGISVLTGSVFIASSTIASNVSTYVAGGIGNGLFSVGTVQVLNSIIAGNSSAGNGPDVLGPFYSSGYNLIGDPGGSTGFTSLGDQVNVNPLLGSLANYGGPTTTMALRAGSPAIDKGWSLFALKVDQRGSPVRLDDPGTTNAPGGDGSDIGAFEVDPRFRIVNLSRVGNDVGLSLMTVLGKNYRADYTADLASGTWGIFTNDVAGNGWLLWLTNSGGANQPRRFYRGAIVP